MSQSKSLKSKEFPEEVQSILGPVRRLIFPSQGDTSEVAFADTAAGRYAVKRARGEQFGSWLKQEYRVLQELAEAPFPTPQPYVFLQRETNEGLESWLVMSHLPGEPLIVSLERESVQSVRRNMLRAFGSILASIHRSAVPTELQSDRTLEQAEYNFSHYSTEGSAALLEQLKSQCPRPVASTMIHGDFTVENILVSAGKVTGIIDWAGGGMGDPRYDVGLAVRPKRGGLFHSQQDREAFFEGYGLSSLSESEYEYFVGLYEFF